MPTTTPTPTETCADCPTPPSGAVDLGLSTLRLALLPTLALLVALSLFVLGRHRLVAVRPRTAAGASVVLAAAVATVPVIASAGSFPPLVIAVLAVSLATVAVAAWTLDRRSPAVGLVLAVVAWTGTWTVATLLADTTVGATLDGAVRLALPSLTVLAYPFGASVGLYHRTGDRRWIAVVGAVMAVVTITTMAGYVPLPGGPAVLVVPAVAVFVVLLLGLSTPLVALGAAQGANDDDVPATRTDSCP